MPLFWNMMYIKASKAKKDWRNFQDLCGVYTCSVTQRGHRVECSSDCKPLLAVPKTPGSRAVLQGRRPWALNRCPKSQGSPPKLWVRFSGSCQVCLGKQQQFGKEFLVGKFLTTFSSKGFGVILFVEWESCRIPHFWINPEIFRHPGISLSIRAFGGRAW